MICSFLQAVHPIDCILLHYFTKVDTSRIDLLLYCKKKEKETETRLTRIAKCEILAILYIADIFI